MPRSICWIAVTLATVCLGMPAGALGSSDGDGGHGHPSAADLGALLADDWASILALPEDRNPVAGNGDPCVMLRRRVLSPELGGPGAAVRCTVRARTRVFLVAMTSECSDVEAPPFYALGEVAQQECARASDQDATSLVVTLDGRSLELRSPRFEVLSPQRFLELPEGNILTGTAGTVSFSAHGWVLLTRPLRRGHHVLSLTVAGGDAPGTATLSIDVVARHRLHRP